MNFEAPQDNVEIFGPLANNLQLPLFRYMKLSTLLLLLEGEAFFPSVANLCKGDPFEGSLFCEPEWLMTALTPPKLDPELHTWLRKKARELEGKHIDDRRTPASLRSQFLSDIYTRELRHRRAAWCWFQDDLESAGMWSVYGHNGVAVRTTLGALKCSLPSNRKFQLAKMRYVDRRTSSDNAFDAEDQDRDLILRPHLLKAFEYRHENEIRVVTQCPAMEDGVLIKELKWDQLIKEIIISPLLPRAEVDAIAEMLSKHKLGSELRIGPSELLPKEGILGDGTLSDAIRQSHGGCVEPGLPAFLDRL
jgi:hypothetical protein